MTWTIVQHSAYGNGGKPGFVQATETRIVLTPRERRLVEESGGLLFESYVEAEEFSEQANYPQGHEGLYSQRRGKFSQRDIDGPRIYLPVRQATG